MNFKTYFLKEEILSEWQYIEEILDLINIMDKSADDILDLYISTAALKTAINDFIIKSIDYSHFKKIYNDIRKYYFKNNTFMDKNF